MIPTSHLQATPAQIKALREYAARNGRLWKSKLRECWMTGSYERGDDSMNLQQVRNNLGPSWLIRFRIPPAEVGGGMLEDLEMTNGEGAMVDSIVHFIGFLRDESAPIPNTSDELNKLMASYVLRVRREQMDYVDRLRKERGQAPLGGSR